EAVGFVEGHAAATAQQTPDLVLGGGFLAGIGLGADEDLVVSGIVALIGTERNQHQAVGRIVADEEALAALQHTDHAIRSAIHDDILADRVFLTEERLSEVVPNDHHVRAVVILGVGKEAALV